MAAAQLIPANGAVALPGAPVIDFGSFEITEESAAESVACYGAAVYDNWRLSGTPHQMVSVAGFTKGHVANSAPFGSIVGTTDPDGASATFTIDTNHTVAGSFITTSSRLSHARLRAAIPLLLTLHTSGDPVVSWAST